ncbi:hypothetical protein DYU11_18380 [Fibrisoma montanum]|uniref:Phage tail tape measure protein n=1 Tax=Fibrisoma montanum TaxID=2305895 RepID=A0A418M683_9BACT|nr:hypothetical protein [Fibrisoma montanum]RIV21374.1 hypothetical protein DYU11_18380 [Fibrisoma montanum]
MEPYSFDIKINDLASGPVLNFAKTFKGVEAGWMKSAAKFANLFSQTGENVDDLSDKLNRLQARRKLMVDSSAIEAADRDIAKLQRHIDSLQKRPAKAPGFMQAMSASAPVAPPDRSYQPTRVVEHGMGRWAMPNLSFEQAAKPVAPLASSRPSWSAPMPERQAPDMTQPRPRSGGFLDMAKQWGSMFDNTSAQADRLQTKLNELTTNRALLVDSADLERADRLIARTQDQLTNLHNTANRPASGLFDAMRSGVNRLTGLLPSAGSEVEQLEHRLVDLTARRTLVVDYEQAVRADREIARLERQLVRAQSQANRPASGFFNSLVSGARRMVGSLASPRQSVDQLNQRLNELTRRRDLMVNTADIARANREIQELERRMDRMRNTGRSGSSSGSGGFMDWLKPAAGMLVAGGLVSGAMHFAQKGMQREQVGVAFEQFVGKQGIAPMMSQLNTFANVTPYTNDEVYGAGRNLLAAKVGPGELNQKLTNVGNMAAVSQKDFLELTSSYAKIKAKGFADSGELHQEFGGTLLMDQLKKNLGVDGEGLFKMAEKRQIRFADIDKAIADLSAKGGAYEGGLEKLSKTAGGKLSTMLGTFEDKIATWAASENTFLGTVFDFGTSFLSQMQPLEVAFTGLLQAFKPIGDSLFGLAVSLGLVSEQGSGVTGIVSALTTGINLLTTAVEVVASPFGQLVLLFAGALKGAMLFNAGLMALRAQGIVSLATGLQALWAVMLANPITAILVGFVALGTLLKTAYDNVDWFRNAVDRAWLTMKGIFNNIGVVLRAIIMPTPGNLKAAFDVVGKAWNSAGTILETKRQEDKRAQAENERDDRKKPYKPVAGANSVFANKPFGNTVSSSSSVDKAKSSGIQSGVTGAKSTNITINLKSLIEGGVHLHTSTVNEGIDDFEERVKETLIRVLDSANAIDRAW